MGFLVHGEHDVTPYTTVIDLNAYPVAVTNGAGPYVLGLAYWLATADAGVPGSAFDMTFYYTDPAGVTQFVAAGGFINLDGGGTTYQESGMHLIMRQSGSSMFEVRLGLSGPPGTSKVSWQLLHYPSAPGDLVSW